MTMPLAEDQQARAVFVKARDRPTKYLYVANCGPGVGMAMDAVLQMFARFGHVEAVQLAPDSTSRLFVTFAEAAAAAAAKDTWHLKPCPEAGGRAMVLNFADVAPPPGELAPVVQLVALTGAEVAIPGLSLHLDFVSAQQEEDLLAAVQSGPWQTLAKRRVLHYGYEFQYKVRNVDVDALLGLLPAFVAQVAAKIEGLAELAACGEPCAPLDQLTVNEYRRGVGLAPHVDTHSAFEGAIAALSLAGPCVMEFRRPPAVAAAEGCGRQGASPVRAEERRAVWLPPRSLLVMAGEARYAWAHYIPHRKEDIVGGRAVRRADRRVSFTFRKVRRSGRCCCQYPEHCDSQG